MVREMRFYLPGPSSQRGNHEAVLEKVGTLPGDHHPETTIANDIEHYAYQHCSPVHSNSSSEWGEANPSPLRAQHNRFYLRHLISAAMPSAAHQISLTREGRHFRAASKGLWTARLEAQLDCSPRERGQHHERVFPREP